MTDFSPVEDLLRQRIGLDPRSTGPGLVPRASRARMRALGLAEEEVDHYRALAARSPDEFQALVEEVVIPESWFFRDEKPFEILAEWFVPRWLADASRPPLRVLSVPCAAGEEPYSIAIALIDRGLAPWRFEIDAIDLSRVSLELARRAVYSARAFRSRDLAFRDRHFRRTDEGYALSDAIKSTVRFHERNLLDPGLFADQAQFDAIFCRNLLIYFDEPARLQALANLDRLLAPTGLLFVGHAEQLGLFRPKFRPLAEKGTFAFERAPVDSKAQVPRPAPKRTLARLDRPKPGPPVLIAKPAAAPPMAVVAPAIDNLEEAARLADLGRHAEAEQLCEAEMSRAGPSARAFFLLGLIHQAAGDRERARRDFEKAVYLDPTHDEALVALALQAEGRGDAAAAAGYRRRAERAVRERTAS